MAIVRIKKLRVVLANIISSTHILTESNRNQTSGKIGKKRMKIYTSLKKKRREVIMDWFNWFMYTYFFGV